MSDATCPLNPGWRIGHCECWSELGDRCCFCGSEGDDDIPYNCAYTEEMNA